MSEAGHKLNMAASKNDLKLVEKMLLAGVDVDSYDTDEHHSTALQCAAYYGHADCVRLLLRHGAGVDITNSLSSSPLLLAAWQNRIECVKVLLEAGADESIVNHYGNTCLTVPGVKQAVVTMITGYRKTRHQQHQKQQLLAKEQLEQQRHEQQLKSELELKRQEEQKQLQLQQHTLSSLSTSSGQWKKLSNIAKSDEERERLAKRFVATNLQKNQLTDEVLDSLECENFPAHVLSMARRLLALKEVDPDTYGAELEELQGSPSVVSVSSVSLQKHSYQDPSFPTFPGLTLEKFICKSGQADVYKVCQVSFLNLKN